ncbi:MAG TPA: heparan-alpha-glucosaminide N-acetyltransferase domain-containing protein [Candidatus Limnocylindrales bacterium]|nr:heparan-alpha-glucosaminide N-acetyltransferase domain-containing protein [Candidatus Limnocylindrales bacterium]
MAARPPGTPAGGRKQYLDWLRGVAVLIMIQGHVVDSWTLASDRGRSAYGWITIVGGIGGAPVFLFLAGVALALAASARTRAGRTEAEAAALARQRGWQIFGLAFLFRLQAWMISGGEPGRTLLKVDILNIMGLSMLAAALLWGLGRTRTSRAALLTAAVVAAAMLTPALRTADVLAGLPDPVEGYLRPIAGTTAFTMFPWAGFVFAGGALGLWLDAARTLRQERLVQAALAAGGVLVALGGYGASFLPPLYEETSFWTSSPTFFFVRLGMLLMLLPVAYVWNAWLPGRSPLAEFGRSSLFVYWIHVEMAYGVISAPLHRRLPLELAMLGVALLSVLLFALVKVKARVLERYQIGHLRNHRAAQHLAAALVPPLVVDQEKVAERPVNDVEPQV